MTKCRQRILGTVPGEWTTDSGQWTVDITAGNEHGRANGHGHGHSYD